MKQAVLVFNLPDDGIDTEEFTTRVAAVAEEHGAQLGTAEDYEAAVGAAYFDLACVRAGLPTDLKVHWKEEK